MQWLGDSGKTVNNHRLGDVIAPRVTAELQRKPWAWRDFLPGFALDLTVNDSEDNMPCDFSKSGNRATAIGIVQATKPYMVIESPCCTAFTTWQAFNAARAKDPENMRRAKARAVRHIEFMVLYISRTTLAMAATS